MLKKYFKLTLLFIVLAELISLLIFYLPKDLGVILNNICFLIIIALTLVFSLKKLEYGIYIVLAELIIGSKGYLFSFELSSWQLSLRIGLFLIVMAVWLAKFIIVIARKEKVYWWINWQRETDNLYKWFVALFIVLSWGFIWGLVRGNTFDNVFLDFNNWLYFLVILPFIEVWQDKEFIKKAVIILLACLSWLAVKTLILLYIFSHQFVWALPEVYKWVRDTGVGEVTRYSGNFYRVFFQSHVFALLGFFVLWPFIVYKNKLAKYQAVKGFLWLVVMLLLSSVVISFSRSFWLGLVAGLGIIYLFFIFFKGELISLRLNFKKLLKSVNQLLIAVLLSLGIIFVIVYLPPTVSNGELFSLLEKRVTQIEAAGSSRINLLRPLLRAIVRHPVIGSGFGSTITYKSADPRIVASTAAHSGEYTTYAFEWGYLDMWLKFGLVGFVIYLGLLIKLLKLLWQKFRDNLNVSYTRAILFFGLFLSLLVLMIVNITTPYLNHPLGIGWVILLSALVGNFNLAEYSLRKDKIN